VQILRSTLRIISVYVCFTTKITNKSIHGKIRGRKILEPVPVAARSHEARTVFGRSNIGIVASNLTRGIDVCLRFSMLCCPVCR
jgi:hypothetical protein